MPGSSPHDYQDLEEESEDEYMKMVIDEPPRAETSLQRAERERNEAYIRGHPKTKAELKREERAKQRVLLETAIPATNKGHQLLKRLGYRGGALGKTEDALKEPVQASDTYDRYRSGIGFQSHEEKEEQRRREREREEEPRQPAWLERRIQKQKENDARERFEAIERIAENMTAEWAGYEERRAQGVQVQDSSLPFLEIFKESSVVYRSITNRWSLETGENPARQIPPRTRFAAARDPEGDYHMEEDDVEDDLSDSEADKELGEYEGLPYIQRTWLVAHYLRVMFWYCPYCKYHYANADMRGCSQLDDEDAHDECGAEVLEEDTDGNQSNHRDEEADGEDDEESDESEGGEYSEYPATPNHKPAF
ncbi:hypothetical protein P154DRAFT_525676 [Amniculicola lignicola CBS 123094]|uniref:G-patch domain-containing protein n=1 Tax=Amniculicola lignicola CBS 123094 TaxID=1392246 RepID=A0A6A5W2W6_9PLEO|nr:hypothetical protein P154DRAFT_525676 [Amniculicola lignicola CBS 123094]